MSVALVYPASHSHLEMSAAFTRGNVCECVGHSRHTGGSTASSSHCPSSQLTQVSSANQETEATPSEVCDSGQQVKRSGRSRASAVVDMKNLREGVDYGDNSPSQAKRNRTSTSETWKHVRRLLSRELKGAPTDDGLAENTHICTKCGMLLKLTKSKVTSGLSMGWQSLSGLKRWLQSNRHVCLMVRHVETLYHINQHGLFACVPLT